MKLLQEQVLAGQGRLEGRVAALGTRTDVDHNRAVQLEQQVEELQREIAQMTRAAADKDRHVAQYRCCSVVDANRTWGRVGGVCGYRPSAGCSCQWVFSRGCLGGGWVIHWGSGSDVSGCR